MQSLFRKAGRQNVLVVDSDLEAAGQVSEAIAGFSSGYDVLRARSGFEGVQKIENGVVNVVLAAEKLVDMTGATFINILRSLKKSKKKEPICVLLSENGKRVSTTEFDCEGSVDVIRYPVNPKELAYTLDRAMDLDGLNGRIRRNEVISKVLLAMAAVSICVGVVIGVI